MLLLWLLFYAGLADSFGSLGDSLRVCNNWSSCTNSCGGGTRSMHGYRCFDTSEPCNEFCYHGVRYSGGCPCPSWRTGRCCESCRHIHIAHCKPGQQQCGGSPDNIICTDCEDPYYSAGFGRGCVGCPVIANCEDSHCTTPSNVKCTRCYDDKVFFLRTHADRKCERLCAWNNHYCWPGQCSNTLTSSCKCADGFHALKTSSETSCQLKATSSPSILTCETRFMGKSGKMERAMSNSSSTACQYLIDFYGNFQPSVFIYKFMAEFQINITSVNKPAFIQESKFGLTDISLIIKRKPVKGVEQVLKQHHIKNDSSNGTQTIQTISSNFNISLDGMKTLTDGEWLCIDYEAKGGGFLRSIDLRKTPHIASPPVPYTKTTTIRRLCYRYDSSKPEHCGASGSCSYEPLQIPEKITRSSWMAVHVSGWIDPIPAEGILEHASGIESYEITLHEVSPSKNYLKVDTHKLHTALLNTSTGALHLNITSDIPKLYAIYVEVKDIADNIRQSRRFVLYDNSSYIEVKPNETFYVESASKLTQYKWQTHHNDICLNWVNYFYNRFYFENPLLSKVEPDPSGLIQGYYDQSTGVLPISGTSNVYGIIKYNISWARNNGNFSTDQDVSDFQQQRYCKRFSLNDGETYTFRVKAIDIVNNTFTDIRTVYIDRSVPHINNIWLEKNDRKQLFVHAGTDLSKMKLTFEAFDSHSGILEIQWSFGTSDAGVELSTGSLGVNAVNGTTCPRNVSSGHKCYCPDIGSCEFYQYYICMNDLVVHHKHRGDHNRNYFFTIRVTNHARLSNTEHLDILVDDSSPEVGVILEGPTNDNDVDYTSDDTFIVHWHGFIDHESGIKQYRIALTRHCLSYDEINNSSFTKTLPVFIEVLNTESSTRLPANFTGKMFTSIVAINNAMESSNPVCSDGITRDISAPRLTNVSIQNARWSESLSCYNSHIWLLNSNLQKIRLRATPTCNKVCSNVSVTNIGTVSILPTTMMIKMDNEVSDFSCQTLPTYKENSVTIYLPNDHIDISWNFEDNWSQMLDFHVGIGLQRSELNSPSQLSYQSTNKKMFFNQHHTAIGTSELFYIFLKAENKAGLVNIYPIGPIMIDETPPVSESVPNVHVVGNYIVVTWENDTIYDLDQREQINQIFFRFGHEGRHVSPLMEWRLETSTPCKSQVAGCFKYPLKHLQQQDTDLGLDFHVSLIGYNNAGHFLQVESKTFKLPSKFSPGSALVLDIDPAEKNGQTDVDIHFSESTLCAKWNGFRHHENITLEFGVGTSLTGDVIPFREVREQMFYCISSAKLLAGIKYHIFIRSNCSGGQTTSVSNGVIILTQRFVDTNLKVKVGKNCYLQNETLRFTTKSQNGSIVLASTGSFNIGKTYYIYNLNDDTNVTTSEADGKLEPIKDHTHGRCYSFIPYSEHPNLFLINASFTPGSIKIVQCSNNHFIWNYNQRVESYWYFETRESYPVIFEAAIINENNFLNHLSSIVYQRSLAAMSTLLNYTNTKAGMTYAIAVRMCVETHCLKSVLSENVLFVSVAPYVEISVAEIKAKTGKDCFDVTLSWKEFEGESPIALCQWSISEDKTSTNPLTAWETVVRDIASKLYKVNTCLSLPVDIHKRLYACVRVFSEDGQSVTDCKILDVTSLDAYSTNVVYDIDVGTSAWNEIQTAITSANIGGIYRTLHNMELDFTIPLSKVAGVVLYGTERQIEWFLMTQQLVPTLCRATLGCISTVTTNNSYGEFVTVELKADVLYYICAKSNATHIQRELFTEKLEELNSCSDGFFIDGSAPYGGTVGVKQHNDYVNDISNVRISWNGFGDNINASQIGYVDSIKSYSIAVGSRPGGEDLIKYSNIGLATAKVINLGGVQDGLQVFISVKATDHAGLSTVVTTPGLIVDTSPPHTGDVLINQGHTTLYLSSDKLSLHFVNFYDDESGIDRFEVSVGSKPNTRNVFSSTYLQSDIPRLQLPENLLHDGHTYYLCVTAVNRAGLQSNAVMKSFVIDRSVPYGGHVIDGDQTLKSDVDYQEDIHHIKSYWKGFGDIHSSIKFYRVGLGSMPYDDDVEAYVDVGLTTEISWNGSFVPGQKYYTVVEACNKANLCIERVSDGIILDNSAPIHGIVKVGSGGTHKHHVPRSTSVHVHWHGFEDPQSDIARFETCIGITPGRCDIVPWFNCLLQSNVLKTGIRLPKQQYLYATVMAYNKAGIHVAQSSDAFRVDTTPPSLQSLPEFILDQNSIMQNLIQFEPSILRIRWRFDDDESPIVSHFVTLKTHHDGHTPIENIQLGSENNLTIILDKNNWLNNGDTYYAVVTCCNGAGHCTSAAGNDLLIDSTPPHLGGFMPPMTWNTPNATIGNFTAEVLLTWYGFYDQESSIEFFYITVSRSYSGSELSNGTVTVKANLSAQIFQTAIQIHDEIQRNDLLILSIWAQNKAGLNSSVAKVSVNALSATMVSSDSHGVLELEKHSCDIHYCNQDCTCAIIGKPCVSTSHAKQCTMLSSTVVQSRQLPIVNVFPGITGLDLYGQIETASSACLSGHWNLSKESDEIERFEWSIGIADQPIGEGIFDLKNQIPWRDVGLRTQFIYCLSENQTLIHGEKYKLYVRAWYGYDVSSIYTSNLIFVDHTPPTVNRGKFIKDSDASCSLDFDYIDWMETITACWTDVFSEGQSRLIHYTLGLGTSPKADDVLARRNVGLCTNITLTNLTLSHGTNYYLSVTAYNSLGLHTSISSDGFVVDMDRPVAGVVFNTRHHTNAAYQSLNNTMTISWHGFIDHFSGVHSYYVAVMQEYELTAKNSTFQNAGLQTMYTFKDLNLDTGMKLRGLVKAVDAAGHESDISISLPTVVDRTPPNGFKCASLERFLDGSTNCSMKNSYSISKLSDIQGAVIYQLQGVLNKASESSTVEVKVGRSIVPLPIHFQHDGSGQFEHTFLQQETGRLHVGLSGTCLPDTTIVFTMRKCSKMIQNPELAISVQQLGVSTLHIKTMILDMDSGINKIFSGLGTTPGGFQLRALSPIYTGNVDVFHDNMPHGTRVYATAVAINHAGLRSVFYSEPVIIDKTPPVMVQPPFISVEEFTNTTQTVVVTWNVVDQESKIKQCYCQIDMQGVMEDLKEHIPTDYNDQYRLYNVTLKHGDVFVARVRCINGIELATDASSEPFRVSKEPPSATTATVKIMKANEQASNIPDILYQRQDDITVQSNLSCIHIQWSGFIDTTGIEHYEYRLINGQQPVTKWTSAGTQTMSAFAGVSLNSDAIYTVEVRAINFGKYISDSVRTDVLLLGYKPTLTGAPMLISKSGTALRLDWSKVFDLKESAAYVFSLSVGSKHGYDDVVNAFHTIHTEHSISAPMSTLVSPTVNDIFIRVECICVTGLSNVHETRYKLF